LLLIAGIALEQLDFLSVKRDFFAPKLELPDCHLPASQPLDELL
jgi:hypothetical protein